MNINPLIEKIFSDFTINSKIIPIAFLNYVGKSDSYLTYYTWQELPENFYDDTYHAERVSVTVDVFSRKNFKNLVEKVKQTMTEGGFTWTDNASETYEQDTGYFHVPINFQISSPIVVDSEKSGMTNRKK